MRRQKGEEGSTSPPSPATRRIVLTKSSIGSLEMVESWRLHLCNNSNSALPKETDANLSPRGVPPGVPG